MKQNRWTLMPQCQNQLGSCYISLFHQSFGNLKLEENIDLHVTQMFMSLASY